MMYQSYLKRKNDNFSWNYISDWFWGNGGEITVYELEDIQTVEESIETVKFAPNLKIYHKFNKIIDGKIIVLVHAKCPYLVEDNSKLQIKNNTSLVENLV